jgi:hypothetical protein
MSPLTLHFAAGVVRGDGRDVVGAFTFRGTYHTTTGEIRMVKQYFGKHSVLYIGRPDGEGSIHGTWSIAPFSSGPFILRPAIGKATGDEPIQEIGGN